MASLKYFFIVVVAVVACAAQGNASRPRLPARKAIADLESELKQSIGVRGISDVLHKAIEKVKKIVEGIQKQIKDAERKLGEGLQKISIHVANSVSDAIYRLTKVKLDLAGDLQALEKKVQSCGNSVQPEVKALFQSIKNKAETCASEEIAKAEALKKHIVELFEIIDNAPEQFSKEIKKCTNPPDSSSDSSSNSGDDSNNSGDSPAVFESNWIPRRLQIALCVIEEVTSAIEPVPELVYDLVKEVRSLTNSKTMEKIQACAASSLAGSGTELQDAAAKLVTCIVPPSTKNPEDKPQQTA